MLQVRSILDVADNTGAKRAAAIGVLGRTQRYAHIGDVIKAHIKEASPDATVKKGDVVEAVVVRTRKAIHRNDGSTLRFDSNAIVIIDKDQNPQGDCPARRILPAVRQQRGCDHRQGSQSEGNAHLWTGSQGTAREEVHEDHLSRSGGYLSMQASHVKRGDEVVVIAGAEKGKRGKILHVLTSKQRVIVEGVRMIKRHTRKNQQYPQGAIVEREGSLHLSNVMLATRFDERAARRGVAPEQ